MTRRLLFFLLCTLAFGLIAPAPSATAQDKKKVVLWHAYRGAERAALEKTVNQFNGSQGDIHLETLAVPFDALPDKISAAIPRGKGPDLFIFAHDRIGDWAESGVVEPINFYLQSDASILNGFYSQTLEALIYRDSLYGLPMAYKTTALYYNKDLMAAPPKDTAQLIEMGQGLTKKDQGQYGLVYENANFYYHSAWMHGFGAQLFDAQGKLTFNTPEMAQSFEFARDLKTKYDIMPDEVTNTLVTSLFNDGKAAMVISGPWFAAELKDDLNYGVSPLPVISQTGKNAAPFLGSEALMMSAKSTQKAEAYTAMVYLTGQDAAKIRLVEGRQTVATTGAYNGVTDPFIQAFKNQLEHSVPMSNSPKMMAVWTPVTNVTSKVIGNRAEPKAAVEEGQKQIEAALQSRR